MLEQRFGRHIPGTCGDGSRYQPGHTVFPQLVGQQDVEKAAIAPTRIRIRGHHRGQVAVEMIYCRHPSCQCLVQADRLGYVTGIWHAEFAGRCGDRGELTYIQPRMNFQKIIACCELFPDLPDTVGRTVD
jgi:hypothetical protein